MSVSRISLISLIFIGALFSGTPVIDGIFDGEAVWGQPVHVADGLPGFAGANAKEIYVTDDENYIYFGAKVSAGKWMSWAFIVNTKSGGGSYDSWSRSIDYAHADLPDYAPRGHFGGTGDQDNNYAELNYWNGTAWDGYVGLAQSEFADTISVNDVVDGWIEIRILKSEMGNPDVGDVQFYITGDNNNHGNFDSCPDDDTANDWDMSANHNILDTYQMNVTLNSVPAALSENSVQDIDFRLLGNFPNPFNPSTTIRFTSKASASILLSIYNTRGQKIFTDERQFTGAGQHEWPLSVRQLGSDLTSGIYFYSLIDRASGQRQNGKMILIK